MKTWVGKLFGESDTDQIIRENTLLRERQFRQIEYIRAKTNQMLMLMGTLPLRPDELNDDSLLDTDPIGTIAEAFVQILDHEKELGDRIRLAHDEMQAIMASVGVGIIVLDVTMRIQMHNQKILELFPFSGKTFTGELCSHAICGVSEPPENCTCQRVLESRRAVHQLDWVNNGRHFDVVGTPVKNRLGDITHIVLVYNDITSRVLTERSLRDIEQNYLSLFEHVTDMVQCVAADGSLLFVNRTWRETLGYSSDEIAGLKFWNIIAPDHRKACLDMFDNLLHGVRPDRIDTVFFSKTGQEIPVRGTVGISIVDGKPTASLGIFRMLESEKDS